MTGEKMARIRRCRICTYWRNAHSDIWVWPHCIQGGADNRELSDAFLDGPLTNCPINAWAALVAADLATEALQGRLRGYDQLRLRLRPAIWRTLRAALTGGIALSTVRAWILSNITNADYALWIAVDMVKEMVATQGVPDAQRLALLKDGAAQVLARAIEGGNDAAWRELRNAVEAGVCSGAEAQSVATQLGITEPVGG